MTRNIIKYSLFFFVSSLGCMAIIILFALHQENRDTFSQILADLGSFGGFLSGIGTIIAASAAAVGVDSWIKHLKYGRFLNVIWNTKLQIKKIEYAIIIWDLHNFNRPNDDLEEEAKLEFSVKSLISEAMQLSHEVDVLNQKSEHNIAESILNFQLVFKEILDHLQSYHKETEVDAIIVLDNVLKELREKRKNLLSCIYNELDILEIKYSKRAL